MILEIPSGDFAGYLFDLDGTLVDSMPAHYRAWDAAMRRFGLNQKLDEELFYSLGGVPTTRVAELFGNHYGLALDAAEVMEVKEKLYREGIGSITLIEPVAEFARRVALTKPIAIVTGGTPDVAFPSLEAAGLADIFKIVITPLDVPVGRGKPAPDMFLLAASRMGVDPKKCLVFEDAEPGIQAALAAGMQVVRVPSRPRTASAA
ncbi:MAG TPA: HAD family phosphatase [Opitutaceae bacterium]|jgi:HAD superfamily hydrolase (TIGR01509 family)